MISMERKDDIDSCLDDKISARKESLFALILATFSRNIWKRLLGSHALDTNVQVKTVS